MKELVLAGTHFEMGRQYGRSCRKQIWFFSKAVQIMVSLSQRPGADLFSPQYRHVPVELARFSKNRQRHRRRAREFCDSLRTHYPEGLDMLRGMAEGAQVDFDDLLFLNTTPDLARGCTTIAATGTATATGEPVLGMNADETRGVERLEMTLDIRPDHGYRHKVTGMAGYLSYNFGMNETGLTQIGELLFLNNESTAPPTAPLLLHASILSRCGTVDEARDLLESLPPCGPGAAVYVADSERFLRMETNAVASEIEVIDDGIRWNTNEPQTPTLAPFSAIDDLSEPTSLFSRSRARRLTTLSEHFAGRLDASAMQSILADHGDPADDTHMHSMCLHPRHTDGKQTCASIVALPRQKRCKFFEPNPCRGDHTEHVF